MRSSTFLARAAAALAAGLLGLAATLTAAGPAGAVSPPVELPRLIPSANFQAELAAEVNSWTLAKIARVAINPNGSDAVAPTGGWDNLSAPWPTGQGAIARTAGKLLIESRGTLNPPSEPSKFDACSANVVTSGNKSVIAAAGHCFKHTALMNGGIGDWVAVNAVFIPGFNGANLVRGTTSTALPGTDIAPYGVWGVTRVFIPQVWNGNPDFSQAGDLSMALVAKPGESRPIEEVTGGQKIGFNLVNNPQTVYQFGYPLMNDANWYWSKNNDGTYASNGVAPSLWRTNDGRSLMATHGTSFEDDAYYGNDVLSAMSPGSSGGPWLLNFDPATGSGTQIGVTSRFSNATGDATYLVGWVTGPAQVSQGFGGTAQGVYNAAQAATVN